MYDIQKSRYTLVPNKLLLGLKRANNLIKVTSKNKEYLNFLKSNDYIQKLDKNNEQYFPKLNLKWDFPSKITNCLIDLNYFNESTLNLLVKLNVVSVGVIITDQNIDKIGIIKKLCSLDFVNNTSIYSFELIFKCKELNYRRKNISDYKNNKFITKIYYDFPDKPYKTNTINRPNILLFCESQKHNTYYNRKLYISELGEIKNAPETNYVAGNISNFKKSMDLEKVIAKKQFQAYWRVTKDNCSICSDCELRYCCVDKRLPVNRNDNTWYHTTECDYNPYIAKWKGEDGFLSLSECGIESTRNTFKIDHDKLVHINKVLWG